MMILIICYLLALWWHFQLNYVYCIEVIDFSALLKRSSSQDSLTSIDELLVEQRQTILKIDQALRDDGLFILTNHGIDSELYDGSILAAHRLFNCIETLSESDRRLVSMTNSNSSFGRGYIGFGDESGLSSYFEPKEGFSYGHPDNDKSDMSDTSEGQNLLRIVNKWPKSFAAEDIRTINELFREKTKIAKLVIASLSTMFDCGFNHSIERLYSDCDPTTTDSNMLHPSSLYDISSRGEDISIMRVFHYFHIDSQKIRNHMVDGDQGSLQLLGSSPHTDWGFLTVILADDIRGLQFIPRRNDTNTTRSSSNSSSSGSSSSSSIWHDIPYIPGSLVVNGGDYLSLLTRGVYHSPVHRVFSPGTRNHGTYDDSNGHHHDSHSSNNDRLSFVFFFYPGYDYPVTDRLLSHCCHSLAPRGACLATAITPAYSDTGSDDIDDSIRMGEASIEFNTLLSGAISTSDLADDNHDISGINSNITTYRRFGDYIINKWMEVYRKQACQV